MNTNQSSTGWRVAMLTLLVLFTGHTAAARSISLPAGAIPSLDELAGDWQTAAEVRCLPAINNLRGSAQALRDALAVGKLSFPPITMTGDTGSLLIDGKPPVLEQTRWFPYQVLRRSSAGDIGVETAVRMWHDANCLLFHVVLTNNSGAPGPRTFELRINLTAATSRHDRWGWGVPRDKTAAARFSAKATNNGQSLVLSNSSDHLANCFALMQKPNELTAGEHSGEAIWRVSLKPKESFTVNYVLAIDQEDARRSGILPLGKSGGTPLPREAVRFDAAFAQVQTDWQTRFAAMFTPGNPYFSGNLPVLVTPDAEMRRVYYMSAVSLLSVYRTGFPVQRRVYVSNSPESNCTMMYFWDTREWATAFALLDPEMLKSCLRAWLAAGIHKGYAEEYLTGTLQGPWYSANDYSVFILLNAYLDVTGDRAFLSEQIDGKTVLEHIDAIATSWKSLVHPGRAAGGLRQAGQAARVRPHLHQQGAFVQRRQRLDDAPRGRIASGWRK